MTEGMSALGDRPTDARFGMNCYLGTLFVGIYRLIYTFLERQCPYSTCPLSPTRVHNVLGINSYFSTLLSVFPDLVKFS